MPNDLGTRLFGARQRPGIPGVYSPGSPGTPQQWSSPSGLYGGTSMQGAQPSQWNPQGLQSYGISGQTPTGMQMPTQNFRQWSDFIKKYYGMEAQDFVQSDPAARYGAYAETQGVAQTPEQIPTGPSGMPDRPPQTPQEAALFQWYAGEQTRQRNEQLLNRAMAAYQYALGTLRRGGPGSLYEATQPVFGQMAQTLSTSEYQEPDFSFWLTPQAYGG